MASPSGVGAKGLKKGAERLVDGWWFWPTRRRVIKVDHGRLGPNVPGIERTGLGRVSRALDDGATVGEHS